MAEKKNYLPVIWQSILVGSFVMGLLYFPINTKFDAISKDIARVKKDHITHCVNSKDKFDNVPDTRLVQMQFEHIKETLETIERELLTCRGADEKFQETLQKILIKLN